MSTVVDFIMSWKDLITKVFGEYPLAAAVVTLLTIAVYLGLDREWRKGKALTNLMLVLGGWAVLVPIVGWGLSIFGKIWSVFEATAPVVTAMFGSLYRIYEKHPFLVLSISMLAFLGYFLWKWRFAKVLPIRAARVIVLFVVVIVAAHITSPIADIIVPTDGVAQAKSEKVPQLPPSTVSLPSAVPNSISQPPVAVPAKATDPLPTQVSMTATPAVQGTLRDKAGQHP